MVLKGLKVSRRITVIAVLLLVIISLNGILVAFLIENIEDDAKILNYSGILRGSIQRIVKLEISHTRPETLNVLIKGIDELIKRFLNGENQVKTFTQNGDYRWTLQLLNDNWEKLKEIINEYRADPTAENEAQMIQKSEELWLLANDYVLMVQSISEYKMHYFHLFFLVTVVNLILVLVIILVIKKLVRDKLEYSVYHDYLTGLWNRWAFEEFITKKLEGLKNSSLSLIMFDIDHFKTVNDNYGHDTGDNVLQALGQIVEDNIRKTDILCRVGGEEFMILAPETDIDAAVKLAERIRFEVGNYDFERVGQVTVSLGVTEYVKGDTRDIMMKKVDEALYQAKSEGRNRIGQVESLRTNLA